MAMIDTLKLAHALRDKAGFTQENAEATAEALNDAIVAGTATKADIAELGGKIAALDAKLSVVMWAVGILGPLNLAITLGVLWRVVTLPHG
jgi:hypothetical protein